MVLTVLRDYFDDPHPFRDVLASPANGVSINHFQFQ